MADSHHDRVLALLTDAAVAHTELVRQLPADMQASLPVDAQGVTRAIDQLAIAAGLSKSDRLGLIKPHAVNPAVLHARVYGRAPLAPETVLGSFVDGARVRADALAELADLIGGTPLGTEVRRLLVENPPPVGTGGPAVVAELRATYVAQERAALLIAERLDAVG